MGHPSTVKRPIIPIVVDSVDLETNSVAVMHILKKFIHIVPVWAHRYAPTAVPGVSLVCRIVASVHHVSPHYKQGFAPPTVFFTGAATTDSGSVFGPQLIDTGDKTSHTTFAIAPGDVVVRPLNNVSLSDSETAVHFTGFDAVKILLDKSLVWFKFHFQSSFGVCGANVLYHTVS